HAKRRVEILRHGADVPDRRILAFVIPCLDSDLAEPVQHVVRIYRGQSFFSVTITETGPRATARIKPHAGRRASIGKNFHSTRSAHHELVGVVGDDVRVYPVTPNKRSSVVGHRAVARGKAKISHGRIELSAGNRGESAGDHIAATATNG